MKRILTKSFLLFAISISNIGNTQTIEKLDAKGAHAQFSSDEEAIIISKSNYSTIEKFNLSSRKQVVLEKGRGIAYNSYIDNNTVYLKGNDSKTKTINIQTGEKGSIAEDKSPKIAAKLSTLKLGKKSYVVAIDVIPTIMIDGFIVVYSDGSQKEFNPRGKKTYIDISLSPDGEKVLYSSIKGTEILSLTDNTIIPLGLFEASKWIGNNNIIYMSTIDDGNKVIESDVYIFNFSKRTKINLTKGFNGIALYPSSSKDASKVLFNNEKEEVFLITLNK